MSSPTLSDVTQHLLALDPLKDDVKRQSDAQRPSLHASALHTADSSTEPGALYRDSEMLAHFSAIAQVLSQTSICPAIAWGDFAMTYYGIPTVCRNYHLLIRDDLVEEAHQLLLAAGYVDEAFVAADWKEFDVPFCQVASPPRNGDSLAFFIQGVSVCKPSFDATDISGKFQQLSGIAIPPLNQLAQSFLHTLTNAPDPNSLLHMLLRVWCSYTKTSGFTPLGDDAMDGAVGITHTEVAFWKTGTWPE